MSYRCQLILFSVIQIVLLAIEGLTRYDTDVRQGALMITNIVGSALVIIFARWLHRRGINISWTLLLLVGGSIWLDALGNFEQLYGRFWWWDRLTHTVGGMAISAGFIEVFIAQHKLGRLSGSPKIAIWLGMMTGQMLGVLYEISEWLGDLWFKTERVRGPYDTPHDLWQNLLGGIIVVSIMAMLKGRELKPVAHERNLIKGSSES